MPTIRQLRDQAGWTQVELAERLGVTANTVARWERGEVSPDNRSRRLLELVLGVRPSEIDYLEKSRKETNGDA